MRPERRSHHCVTAFCLGSGVNEPLNAHFAQKARLPLLLVAIQMLGLPLQHVCGAQDTRGKKNLPCLDASAGAAAGVGAESCFISPHQTCGV